ncbi:major facilitator superfamily domain-containing protein [Ditylenchus destructor]|uniref:Major facilitator superfamily domain-containing protein n=1 Tax=Ditylenchus destructor TaxID=166010 RepID=A0AAD4R8A4_9BILA|nr:major facilitator superfamily domain-containing protein [Ditylenchus destructor]
MTVIHKSDPTFPSFDNVSTKKATFVQPGLHQCGGHFRYMVLFLGTTSLSILLACVISFNPAVVVMTDLHSSPLFNRTLRQLNNSSTQSDVETEPDYNDWNLPLHQRRFVYTNFEKSILLGVAFGGTLVIFLPVGLSMQKWGAWRTQIVIGFIVSIGTALIPWAATTSFILLCVVRFMVGLAMTNFFPVVGSITNHWSSLKEKGLFLSVLSGYIQLSCVMAFPLAGFLAENFGWPSVFYVHAVLGFIIFTLWTLLYRDHPQTHPCVSKAELELIEFGQQAMVEQESAKPPYKQILKTSAVWAIFIAVIGNFCIIQFANTFFPMLLRLGLGYSISTGGLIAAIPLLLQFFVKSITGFATDHLEMISDLVKVKFCNTVAFCGSATFFLAASIFSERWFVVVSITLAISVLGFSAGGFTKNVVLVSRQFTPTVMAGVQMLLCITLFTGSFVVPLVAPDGAEYGHVFWMYAVILVATNTAFLIWGSANPASWTKENHPKDNDHL